MNQIADLCRQHHIREPALFGPVWRDDFDPESDVDVLIEFEPEADENLTLLDLAGIATKAQPIFTHRAVRGWG